MVLSLNGSDWHVTDRPKTRPSFLTSESHETRSETSHDRHSVVTRSWNRIKTEERFGITWILLSGGTLSEMVDEVRSLRTAASEGGRGQICQWTERLTIIKALQWSVWVKTRWQQVYSSDFSGKRWRAAVVVWSKNSSLFQRRSESLSLQAPEQINVSWWKNYKGRNRSDSGSHTLFSDKRHLQIKYFRLIGDHIKAAIHFYGGWSG